MPIHTCQKDKKPSYKWGDRGRCYIYTKGNNASEVEALRKASTQRAAIKANA